MKTLKYPRNVPSTAGRTMSAEGGEMELPRSFGDRMILRGGRVIDPLNGTDCIRDVVIEKNRLEGSFEHVEAKKGDRIVDCTGLLVLPGLIDMHVHLGDLFEVSTDPISHAAADGVTMGLSPGAGNTFLAPSLLGAEVDRGVPINLGLYIGAAAMMSTMLSKEELVLLFEGKLDPGTAAEKMTRNAIGNTTAPFAVGIKDHMGHFLMPDDRIRDVFEITDRAGLVYMSHTQDPAHAERMVSLSDGHPLHLAHATAAGCGTHDDPERGMKRVLDLVGGNVTAEFVTTMLRPNRGNREGLVMTEGSRDLALQALADGKVKILVSDGQNDATMKGFGDTRDDVPAILELAEEGVVTLPDAVAMMTCNPAELLSERTHNPFFRRETGHLGKGALANVTVVDPVKKYAVYTIVNGRITAFEGRTLRSGYGAGGWISRFGMAERTGVGDFPMFSVEV
ncbi:MAG: amidohydrolase family protein [Oscillospiraceae bacterium]